MQGTTATGTTPSAKSPPNRSSGNLGLSCRECQRKKIKCDRRYPCTACSRAGTSCTPSARKPRAKIGAKAVDAELRHRIAKLEQLVETFHKSDETDVPQSAAGVAQSPPSNVPKAEHRSQSVSSSTSGAANASEATSPASAKFVAASFWSSLTAEVQALKGVFEEDGHFSDDEGESAEISPAASDSTQPTANPADGGYELLFCPPGEIYVMPGALHEPDAGMAETLVNAYVVNIESMYRVLHLPSLTRLLEGKDYLGQPPSAPSNKALVAAVQFGGATTLTNDECYLFFGKSRDEIVRQCRNTVDIRICQADPLNTSDMATLQALCIYIGAIRVIDPSRRSWSMTGLIVRIARALYLHRETTGLSPYFTEIRRRLWYSIVFLDCYSIFDRGSEPIIDTNSFTTLLPSNVNDSDFDESSTSITARTGELTDMTFARVMCEAARLMIQIGSRSSSHETWQERLNRVHQYQVMIRKDLLPYCNSEIPTHAHWIEIADATVHSVILRAVRPVEIHLAHSQPRVDSPWVLGLAVNILRYGNQSGKFSVQTPWRRMPWVPWHAMAVTLAGLCSIKDTPLADEAWMLVEKAMSRFSVDIADSSGGMLWRPILKIHRKALKFRNVSQSTPPTDPSDQFSGRYFSLSNDPDNNMQQPLVQTTAALQLSDTNADINMVSPYLAKTALDLSYLEPMLSSGPDVQAQMPQNDMSDDNSWWDWETMLSDMNEVTTDLSLPT